MKSEFDLNQYIKEYDDKGTYLIMKNGHLNQVKQMYTKTITDGKKGISLKLKKGLAHTNVTPGPGSYETNASSVISTEASRKMNLLKTSRATLAGSPSNFVSGTIN